MLSPKLCILLLDGVVSNFKKKSAEESKATIPRYKTITGTLC